MLVLFCQYGRPETVRMQISHIVVMVLMFAVKDHVEIAGIQAGLDNTRDCNPVTGKRQRIQCFLQQLFIRPQIQKRRNQHISADSAGTVKNQRFSSFFQNFFYSLSYAIHSPFYLLVHIIYFRFGNSSLYYRYLLNAFYPNLFQKDKSLKIDYDC